MEILINMKQVILTAAFLFLAGSTIAAAQAQPCGCADHADMLNRIDEANVSISEYLYQKRAYGTKAFSSFDYSELIQKTLQEMLNKAHKSGTNSVKGGTNVGTCDLRPLEPGSPSQKVTPCLEAGVRIHERVHMDACDIWKKDSGTFRGNDYRSSMTMAEYLDEEIRSYEAEKSFFKDQINKMACKPAGWIGVVRYEESTKLAKTETLPPSPKRLSGQKSSELSTTRLVSILAGNGDTNASQIYALRQTENSEYDTKIACRTSSIVHHFAFSSLMDGKVRGFGKPLSFSVSQNGPNDYMISFAVPGITGGTVETSGTAAPYPPECGQPNKPIPSTTGPFAAQSEVRYTVRGKGKLSDNFLSGHETIPQLGGFQTITISWELKRWKDSSPNVSIRPLEKNEELLGDGAGTGRIGRE